MNRNAFKKMKSARPWMRRLALFLAVVIVFSTTYALILPALAITDDVAEEQPGIILKSESSPAPETEAGLTAESDDPALPGAAGETLPAVKPETVELTDKETDENAEPVEIAGEARETERGPIAELIAQITRADERPAQEFEGKLGSTTVTVKAGQGALPKDTVMKLSPADSEALEAIAEAFRDEVHSVVAVDISFYDAEGNEIQPAAPIRVTIASQRIASMEETSLVHVENPEDAPAKAQVLDRCGNETKDAEISFRADSFSVYAIVGTDSAEHELRVRYVFQEGDGTPHYFDGSAGQTDNQIVISGGSLYDVGVPAKKADGTAFDPATDTFSGWFIYLNGSMTAEEIGFGTAITLATGANATSVTAGSVYINTSDSQYDETTGAPDYTVYVRPVYGAVHYITFYSEVGGGAVYTKVQVEAGGSYDISQQAPEAPESYLFTGWCATPGVLETAGNPDPRTEITSTTVTVDGDMVFYPIFRLGCWISFVSAPAGEPATYFPPAYVLTGESAAALDPGTPVWVGHVFVGWFETEDTNYLSTDETNTGAFDFTAPLDSSVTLYAHWNAGTAGYTVAYFVQKLTDNKNAADADKTYDYFGQVDYSALVGSIVTSANALNTLPQAITDYIGMEFLRLNASRSIASATVAADGSTALNIYLDRKLITMRFWWRSMSDSALFTTGDWTPEGDNAWTFTGLYGQTVEQAYAYPDNEWPWPPDSPRWENRFRFGYPVTRTYMYVRTTGGYANASKIEYFARPNNQTNYGTNGEYEYRFMHRKIDTPFTFWMYYQNVDGSWPTEPTDSSQLDYKSTCWADYLSGPFMVSAYHQNGDTNWTPYTPGANVTAILPGIHFRFTRLSYDLYFIDANTGAQIAELPMQSVRYETPLASVLPSGNVQLTAPQEGYEWDGHWYADPACTIEFTAEDTMPDHAVAVFVKWVPITYWVKMEPNGGALPATEPTYLTVTYGNGISGYQDVTRLYAPDPSGTWYYHCDEIDPATGLNQSGTSAALAYYTQDASLSTDGGITYSPSTDAYTFIGWHKVYYTENPDGSITEGEVDGLYSFEGNVSENLILRALWRTSSELTVKYSLLGVDESGAALYAPGSTQRVTASGTAPSDPSSYLNGASAYAQGGIPAANTPAGYAFAGWYYDGQVYKPGDVFTVSGQLTNDDGELWLYPVFLPMEQTHIYWYANTQDEGGYAIPGVSAASMPSDESSYAEIQINGAYTIKGIGEILDTPEKAAPYANYEFLGWAKNADATTPWLRPESGGSWTMLDTNGAVLATGVTMIAANEIQPNDLYAVWARPFAVDFKAEDQNGNALTGAEYQLLQYNGTTWVAWPDAAGSALTLGLDTLTLPLGQYKIVQTAAPEGYVIRTGKAIFTVSRDAQGNPAVTLASGTPADLAEVQDPTVTGSVATVVLKNPTGAMLPNAGGLGRSSLALPGLVMLAVAAAVYALGRKREDYGAAAC